MRRLSDEERLRLEENIDTMQILYAIDALDEIRALVADEENLRPPEIRDKLLALHQAAHGIINEGSQPAERGDLKLLAGEIEDEVYPILENAEKILEPLRKLIEFAPDLEEFEDDDDDLAG